MTNPMNIGCRIFGHSTVKQPNTIASIKNVFLGPKSVISAIFALGSSFVKNFALRENFDKTTNGSPPPRSRMYRYRVCIDTARRRGRQLPQS